MRWMALVSLLFLCCTAETVPTAVAEAPPPEAAPVSFTNQGINNLSFDGKELRQAFNATSDRGRMVLVFSPT